MPDRAADLKWAYRAAADDRGIEAGNTPQLEDDLTVGLGEGSARLTKLGHKLHCERCVFPHLHRLNDPALGQQHGRRSLHRPGPLPHGLG